MQFKQFEITDNGGGIKVSGVQDLNLTHTFECGQCFRWNASEGNAGGIEGKRYIGVAKGKVVAMSMKGDVLNIENATPDDFINIWYDYLDLGTDYSRIKAQLSKDKVISDAVEFGAGIRILKQDFWETLISFIISSNNIIPRIKKIIATVSEKFGESVEFEGKKYFLFPDIDKMSARCDELLHTCGAGFRCRYIGGTLDMINNGEIDLAVLNKMPTSEARNELIRFPGVGRKVADCVLLYGMGRHEVFPTDVWIKRVMETLYLGRETKISEINDFASNKFGELSGYAQQYLYYYARQVRIGCD